jgi:alkylation response protein AidB-like acyl-CoA dehydrogenase
LQKPSTSPRKRIIARPPSRGSLRPTRSIAWMPLGLLTPVVKALLTDVGFDNAVKAQQVLGGHGYIEEPSTSPRKRIIARPPSRGSLRPTRSIAWMPLAPS